MWEGAWRVEAERTARRSAEARAEKAEARVAELEAKIQAGHLGKAEDYFPTVAELRKRNREMHDRAQKAEQALEHATKALLTSAKVTIEYVPTASASESKPGGSDAKQGGCSSEACPCVEDERTADCNDCGGTGVIEDDATGALGYVVKKTCPSCQRTNEARTDIRSLLIELVQAWDRYSPDEDIGIVDLEAKVEELRTHLYQPRAKRCPHGLALGLCFEQPCFRDARQVDVLGEIRELKARLVKQARSETAVRWVVTWEPPIKKGTVVRIFDDHEEAVRFFEESLVASGWPMNPKLLRADDSIWRETLPTGSEGTT